VKERTDESGNALWDLSERARAFIFEKASIRIFKGITDPLITAIRIWIEKAGKEAAVLGMSA